jgi:outer membrane protein insertion porin family
MWSAVVRIGVLTLVPVLCARADVSTVAEFTVGAIRVDGLQRISEGAVYNYLPVNIGDHLDQQRVQEALKALYRTDFFRDVELRRDGNTLVVVVLERPSIESFEITGNKDIKTEDLQKSLRGVGLASGKTFNRSVLEEVTQYLTDQYYSRGKYAVRVDTNVEELPGNTVKVTIDISEGQRARIRQINIVGNTRFDEDELLDELELKTPNWLSWYRQDDRYARETLQSDLEKLRSFYMDRGYANFRLEGPQVTISPEKDDIFITVNVSEGEVYTIGDVKLAGQLVVPEAELRELLLVRPGQTFSNKLITSTTELLSYRLGADGYAFAKVDAIPQTDEEKKQVDITFLVDPRSRVYVRHINFLGTSSINDEVLRREMRQLEGGWLSNAAVERSKERLQRLPFIEKVDYEITPVGGSPDLVDVDITVKDGLPGQFGGGIGYSDSQSVSLNGSVVHTNLFGKGQRIAAEFNAGRYNTVYSLAHTEPYWTMDGISRSLSVAYRETSQLTSASSEFSTDTWLTGLDVGYPIAERQSVRFGLAWQHAELATSLSSSTQFQDWVEENGNSFFERSGDGFVLGTRFAALELTASWVLDSRDRVLFPTRGMSHRLTLATTVPGSEVEYASAVYDAEQFIQLPFVPWVPFRAHARVGYAQALGDTTATPPHRHFFLGGPDSVRGFRDATLGPRDSLGNPYGGDFIVAGQIEAIVPLPQKFASTTRLSAFYDFGQLAYLGDVEFTDRAGDRVEYPFDLEKFRTSVGVSVQWLAPLGLFRFSYAVPLRERTGSESSYGDELERFQFSVGQAF